MRNSARVYSFARLFYSFLFSLGFGLVLFFSLAPQAHAQPLVNTPDQQQSVSEYEQFRTPHVDANVEKNHHSYVQIALIDTLAAVTCLLTGIDPVQPSKPCLGINPYTDTIGYTQQPSFGESSQPKVGGAIGGLSNMISAMYVPTVSSTQYGNYLAGNFGIVKVANAQVNPGPDCQASPFGYGFCGLQPIFYLWTAARDFAYALLVIAFVALGVGIMVRFKVDPRTVMTLQNQIPRVIIAILLITFSYAIAGIMIDLMWTVTYAGINIIASSSPRNVALNCDPQDIRPIQEASSQNLLDHPLSFTNTIFLRDCEGNIDSGTVNLAARVSDAFGGLVTQILNDALGIDVQAADCGLTSLGDCITEFVAWVTGLIITIIIIVAILIAMLRLWFELIKTYVTLLIFIILGPIWIVLGLVPGRPLGFERWLRIIFANLAVFPLVAFIIVFARVIVDAIPERPSANSLFIPPLIGNPNVASFGVLIGFGALMLAPSIPGIIKDKMKAQGGKYGATIAAGVSVAAGAATAPATKTWAHLNRVNSKTGNPQGLVAVQRARLLTWGAKKSGLGQNYLRRKYGGGYNPYPTGGSGSGGSGSSGSGGSGSGGGTP